MNISAMHTVFRQYAQQMGMQRVRGILPEQIDILINTSISDTINQIIKTNVSETSKGAVTDVSKVGQLNVFRSLYKTNNIDFSKFTKSTKQIAVPSWETTTSQLGLASEDGVTNFLYLVDFAISYKHGDNNTRYFPVRPIDDVYLAEVLNDYILSPKITAPIITLDGASSGKDISRFTIYIGKSDKVTPDIFRVTYIAKPVLVHKDKDDSKNVDCDLPDYMHEDIIKHAVDLYHVSLQGSIYAALGNQRTQTNNNNNSSTNNNDNN